MPQGPPDKATAEAIIVPSFRGVCARVARKLNVSQSLVSKVACGHPKEIDSALRNESQVPEKEIRRLCVRANLQDVA